MRRRRTAVRRAKPVVTLALSALLALAGAAPAGATQNGGRYPSANAAVGTGWTNAQNFYASDTNYATFALAGGNANTSDLSNFDVENTILPGLSNLNVTIQVYWRMTTCTGCAGALTADAYVNGTGQSPGISRDMATSTVNTWYTDKITVTGLTSADLSRTNFKVRVNANCTAGTCNGQADYVRVFVTGVPSSNAAVSGGGWTNPADAYTDDTSYATAALTTAGQVVSSDFGTFDFDSSLPPGASIVNVWSEAAITTDNGVCAITYGIQMYRDGAAVGAEATATTMNAWTTISQVLTNDATGKLGRVNTMPNSHLTVRVRITNTNNCAVNASLDWVRVIVEYTSTGGNVISSFPTSYMNPAGFTGGFANPTYAYDDGYVDGAGNVVAAGQNYATEYGGFDFSAIPANATVERVVIEAQPFSSNSGFGMTFGLWPTINGNTYGAEFTSFTWYQDVAKSVTITGLTRADLMNTFRVRLRHTWNGVGWPGWPGAVWRHLRVHVVYGFHTSAKLPTANDAGWSNSDNAQAENDANAVASRNWGGCGGGTSTVQYRDFGFDSAIPAGATVSNVTIEMRWQTNNQLDGGSYIGMETTVNDTRVGGQWMTSWNNFSTSNWRVDHWTVQGITRSDLTDGVNGFEVKLTNRKNAGNCFAESWYVDYVKVYVSYDTTPTVTSVTPTDNPTWIKGSTGSIGFTTGDADGQSTSSTEVCLKRQNAGSCSSPDGVSAVSWTIAASGASDYSGDGANGNWSLGLTPASGAVTWSNTSIVWTGTITVASGAATGSDWELRVTTTDLAGVSSSTGVSGTVTIAPNSAPTVSDLANAACGSTWTPHTNCDLGFRTTDTEGLGTSGSSIVVCVRRAAATCTGAADHYQRAKWTLTANGASASTVTADGGLAGSTWGLSVTTPASGWTATTAKDWTITVTIGDIARAASDWSFEITATDSYGASASATYGSSVTVPSSMALTASDPLDFGAIAPGGQSAVMSRNITGIKCNTACQLELSTAVTWTDGASTTISPRFDGSAPGAGEFALRCSASDPPPDIASAYIGTSSASADGVSPYAAFTTDTATSQTLYCVLVNGNTRSASYHGAITQTLA